MTTIQHVAASIQRRLWHLIWRFLNFLTANQIVNKTVARTLLPYLDVGTQAPPKADYLVTLGGGRGRRALATAKLYHAGIAPQIIASGNLPTQNMDFRQLAAQKIPKEAIIANSHAKNTWTEAHQILDMLHNFGARSAIIITDGYHTRRTRATFRQIGGENPIELIYYSVSHLDPDTAPPDLGTAILSEYFKMLYYWVMYGVRSW